MKTSADGHYHRFLLENSLIIPEAAKGSGLVVIISQTKKAKLTKGGLWFLNEQALAS